MSKQKQNVSNLLYFEVLSMRELYDSLKSWQDKNGESFLSLNIQQDGDKFCCIAIINPVEAQEIKAAKYGEADAPKHSNSSMLSLSADEIKDLALWYDRARRFLAKSKALPVDWENKHLPEEIAALIRVKLAMAKTEQDIMNAFELGNAKRASNDKV